jgi:hypothetical protein
MVRIGASAGSAGSDIRVRLTYNFSNGDPDDPVTGSCTDNSDRQLDSLGDDVPVQAYMLRARKPASLLLAHDSGVYDVVEGPPTWGCRRDYTYDLLDDASLLMTHVYIVERFVEVSYNPGDFIWYTAGPPIDGRFTDTIAALHWPVPRPYLGGLGQPVSGPEPHYYFAATTDTSYYTAGLSGVLVKLTTTTIWTDYVDHP